MDFGLHKDEQFIPELSWQLRVLAGVMLPRQGERIRRVKPHASPTAHGFVFRGLGWDQDAALDASFKDWKCAARQTIAPHKCPSL